MIDQEMLEPGCQLARPFFRDEVATVRDGGHGRVGKVGSEAFAPNERKKSVIQGPYDEGRFFKAIEFICDFTGFCIAEARHEDAESFECGVGQVERAQVLIDLARTEAARMSDPLAKPIA